jgi:serine protease Do
MGFKIWSIRPAAVMKLLAVLGLGGILASTMTMSVWSEEAPKLVPQAKSRLARPPLAKPPVAKPVPKLPDSVDPRAPIDDRLLVRIMEARLADLVKTGRTLQCWQDQLKPRAAGLELPPKRDTERLSPNEVYERVQTSTVIVGILYKCDRHSYPHVAMASGFVATQSGAVVTNLHVLSTYGTSNLGLGIMTRDARVWPVKSVLGVDPENDLLVLQAEGNEFVPLPLGDDPQIGAAVNIVSHPAERFYYLTSGIVSRYSISLAEGDTSRILNVTGDFARGSSGGPVADDHGRLVGVIRSTESITHEQSGARRDTHQMVIHNCAPVKSVRELLIKRPPPETASKAPPAETAKRD